MQTLKLILLGLLIAAVHGAYGQIPAEWDQWIADGIVADDNSEYKDAERFFTRACDTSLATELGSERLTQACLLLTRVYLVSGQRALAIKTAQSLVEALDGLDERRLVDIVDALILLADGYSANGDLGSVDPILQRATNLAPSLIPLDSAAALSYIASFYLPTQAKAPGQRLLTMALEALDEHSSKSSAEYVEAAVRLGSALEAGERSDDVVRLLSPLVEQAQERSLRQTSYDELWRSYVRAANLLKRARTSQGDEAEAERIDKMKEAWPKLFDKAEFEGGRLSRRVNPVYPPGAKALRMEGTVSLSIEIGTDGRVHNVSVLRPVPYGLSWEAMRAVRLWRYRRITVAGEPVSAPMDVNVVYQLGRR